MTIVDPNTNKAYIDMRRLTIEPNDLIILRTDVEWTVEDMLRFDNEMHNTYPEWGGTIIMMRTDESLEKVPALAVRALYEKLRPQFDPEYDVWKRQYTKEKEDENLRTEALATEGNGDAHGVEQSK